MLKFSRYGVVALLLLSNTVCAQGYQPVTPLYSTADMTPKSVANLAGGEGMVQVMAPVFKGLSGEEAQSPVLAKVDKALGQVLLQWPTDAVSFDQLQTVLQQFPGINNIKLQFPNQSEWSLSPQDLLAYHDDFLKQAGGLGFGVGNTTLPELVFSSLAGQAMGHGALAAISINAVKNGMGEALEPMLRELRYEQLALADYLPAWLKDFLLAVYNMVMPYYYSAVNWIASFF